jgi:hypothetical protein
LVIVSPHRNFRDDDGQEWIAWDVIPSWGERRRGERRSTGAGGPPATGERRGLDRRSRRGIRIALTPRLADGWLAFESNDERRRVAPIPAEWHLMSEERLRALWRNAESLPPRRRLVE